MKEALLMAQVESHTNLVSIIGVITRGRPKILVRAPNTLFSWHWTNNDHRLWQLHTCQVACLQRFPRHIFMIKGS